MGDSPCAKDCERAYPKRQPYIYTLPEQFIEDKAVPRHWKLYALINGFWIAGKPVFASNGFFAEKLKCSERYVRECLETLEEMGVLRRIGKSQNRTIIPGGGTSSSGQGGTASSVREEPVVPHISVSNSDSLIISETVVSQVDELSEDEGRPKRVSRAQYPHSKEVFTTLFPATYDPEWNSNTTQLRSSEAIYKKATVEDEFVDFVSWYKKHKEHEYFPQTDSPYEMNLKWPKIDRHLNDCRL